MTSISLWNLYYLTHNILCPQPSKQNQLCFLLRTPGCTCQHGYLHHTWQDLVAAPGKSNDLIETSRLSWKTFIIHCRPINIVRHGSDCIEKVTVKRVGNFSASTGRSTSKTETEGSQSVICILHDEKWQSWRQTHHHSFTLNYSIILLFFSMKPDNSLHIFKLPW